MAPQSTNELAKTLPRKAPNEECHRATLKPNEYKFAIYSIASLDTAALHQLEDDINNAEFSNNSSKLAPQPDFSGRSLRDVYDYHVRVRDEDETIHPLYFIVADQANLPDCGVLVVHLDRGGEEEDLIGVGRTGVEMADTHGVNIDIGNTDWLDLKEEEMEEWGGDNPYEDDTEDNGAAPETVSASTSSPTRYGCYLLVQKTESISSMLGPQWPDALETRFQMLGDYASLSDPWPQIRCSHPQQCMSRPEIHRTLILVIDHPDANEAEGTSVVRLKWNGDASALDAESGSEVMPQTEVLRKVPASEALRALDDAAR